MNDLVVPLARAAVRIEAHERFGEEVRAGRRPPKKSLLGVPSGT
jgi:hypothetical protein